ncbi:hypothetical protein [Flavobacterium caseinilyticum]|uniref:Uncharacterized protein n=1 Tax=Flavobacterium caseinilyticum TaxID=2541732 RepID=A0A4R5AXR7_9FLAO|nr:hypothetical protein [Flavobacterium caseinilyticum]TDD75482.1 hypothetical protein E0F89_11355 [Flavobacterium caseinilyticum]
MKKINETATLKEAIHLLKLKQANELVILKDQYHYTIESLKPVTLIKNLFTDLTTTPSMKRNLLQNVVGITAGYLTKRVLVGSTHNPIKRIFGTLLQFVVTNITTKHSDKSKEYEAQNF